MKVVIKEYDEYPRIEEVDAITLEYMQEVVGGYIEHLSLTDTIDMWFNEEGKLIPLPTNIFMVDGVKVIDTIQGNILFTSCDDDGNTIGLDERDIENIIDWGKRLDGGYICDDPVLCDGVLRFFPLLDVKEF